MINLGDIVSFKNIKNEYIGKVVAFVPKSVDAFNYREQYKEVSDSNCNFNFVENFDRCIIVVSSGKNSNIYKAYAPAVASLKIEDNLKSYRIQGFVNGKLKSGEFIGRTISEAICNAEKNGYDDIIKVEFVNFPG